MSPTPIGQACDFCGDDATWRYPCRDFSIGYVGSSGAWLACDVCHANIEAGDRDSLARRAISHVMFRRPAAAFVRAEITDELHLFHGLFFLHREGAAAPFG